MSYRKVYILIVFTVLSQGAYARKHRYYVIQKMTNSNSFYSLVPRRYYVIHKSINSNSFYFVTRRYYVNTEKYIFYWLSQGACARASADIMSYRKVYILIVFIVLSQGACAPASADIMLYRKVYILIVFIVLFH